MLAPFTAWAEGASLHHGLSIAATHASLSRPASAAIAAYPSTAAERLVVTMAQSSVGPAPVLTSRARQQRSHTGPSLSRCVLVCLSILGQGWKPAISVKQVRFRGFRDALRTHSLLALRYHASRLCRSAALTSQSAARNVFCTLLVAQILLGLQEILCNPNPNSPANQPANQLFT